MSSSDLSRPTQLPALDGVRGLAICMVLSAHLFGLPGGVFGVDLFFVLSGFLITRLLLADRTASTGYFRRFYIRRALRIAPPYYVLLAIVLVVSPTVRPYGWVFALYLADFPLHRSPSLGHTWSLAIEEQFYLVWPLVVRRVAPTGIIKICVSFLIAGIALRLAIPHVIGDIEQARYMFSFGPLSRTDGLFVGAAIATIAVVDPDWLVRWRGRLAFVALGVLGLLVATHRFSMSGMSPAMAAAGMPAASILFGALVSSAATAPAASVHGRLLTMAWLRRLGRVSYAVYLGHVPILVVFEAYHIDHALGRTGSRMAAGLLAYLLAEVSWYVLERPIARLKERWR